MYVYCCSKSLPKLFHLAYFHNIFLVPKIEKLLSSKNITNTDIKSVIEKIIKLMSGNFYYVKYQNHIVLFFKCPLFTII